MREKSKLGGSRFSMPHWVRVTIFAFLAFIAGVWLTAIFGSRLKSEIPTTSKSIQYPLSQATQESPKPVLPDPEADTYRSISFEMLACANSLFAIHEGARENYHDRRFPGDRNSSVIASSDERNWLSLDLLQKHVGRIPDKIRQLREPGAVATEEHNLIIELQIAMEKLMDSVALDEDIDGRKMAFPICDRETLAILESRFVNIYKKLDLLLPKD